MREPGDAALRENVRQREEDVRNRERDARERERDAQERESDARNREQDAQLRQQPPPPPPPPPSPPPQPSASLSGMPTVSSSGAVQPPQDCKKGSNLDQIRKHRACLSFFAGQSRLRDLGMCDKAADQL